MENDELRSESHGMPLSLVPSRRRPDPEGYERRILEVERGIRETNRALFRSVRRHGLRKRIMGERCNRMTHPWLRPCRATGDVSLVTHRFHVSFSHLPRNPSHPSGGTLRETTVVVVERGRHGNDESGVIPSIIEVPKVRRTEGPVGTDQELSIKRQVENKWQGRMMVRTRHK